MATVFSSFTENATIPALYRLVTPAYSGDYSPQVSEIRAPALKGVLRFWWRALCWQDAMRSANNNELKALEWLHKEESILWGNAAGNKSFEGQGLCSLRVDVKNAAGAKQAPTGGDGIKYLKGMGLKERAALPPGNQFRLTLSLLEKKEHKWTEERRQRIEQVLRLLGLVGGIGARSRRGMGSLQLAELSGQKSEDFYAPEKIKTFFAEILSGTPSALPPFSAFSKKTKIYSWEYNGSAMAALEDLGKKMLKFRASKLAGGLGKFGQDTAIARNIMNRQGAKKAPDRVIFGLPHNYFFKELRRGVKFENSKPSDRRASPLFNHIHEYSGKATILFIVMESVFIPGKIKSGQYELPAPADFSVLHAFAEFCGAKSIL